jgi:regulator of replication initiation timing
LPVITNGKQITDKEQILLVRIKQLEKELVKVKAENSNLNLENKHLKALIKKDQATEAKILQQLPSKSSK